MENIINNVVVIVGAAGVVLGGFITIFSFIPGDQPEKTLKKIVDILAKFSRK